ncbi:MAG: glycosyltransferase [Bacillota bacterium]
MNKIILSVIVPVYNAEKYLHRCIDSILSQTMANFELILINDGSTDNSGEICEAYAKKDCRIIVRHKKNGGAASARNLGLDIACGEYIGFCDADDFLNHNMYEVLIDLMVQYNLPTIECTANTVSVDEKLIEIGCNNKEIIDIGAEDAIKQIYLRKGNVSLCTRVTQYSYIKELKIEEGYRVEDFYCTICLLLQTHRTTVYNYPFYQCRLNSESVTRQLGGSIYLDAIHFFDKSKKLLFDNNNFFTEQNYYIFKMYYLFIVSMKSDEHKKYFAYIKKYRKEIRKNILIIIRLNNLLIKEKIILVMSGYLWKMTILIKNIHRWLKK